MDTIHTSYVTEPDSSYPACERAGADLCIYPKIQTHSYITEALSIKPTEAENKGQLIKNSAGKIRKASLTTWFLSSEPHVNSLDLRHHLDWLIEQLTPCKSELEELQNTPGMKMKVACVWWSVMGHGGPVLWPSQMAALADLNLECAFDVYFFGPEG